jgi:serine/threonine protein kinase/tetratricopeptide (TPR) repeat protein
VCPEDDTPLRADSTVAEPEAASAFAAFAEHKRQTSAESLTGTVLDGKYRLDAPLGAGGMGTVFRAMHLLIERPVAVKVLNPRLVSDPAAQERLRREARAAGRLRHTNAVAVTDFGQTNDGVVYIVMELLEGISLRDLLQARSAPLEPELAVEIMLQTAAAVAAAHEAGIIHRDLKPGNIFILERKNNMPIVKVLDFGIAKVAASEEDTGDLASNEITSAMTLTETGVMIGTPRYMSPEQCDGMRLTPAADVYSLGIILYEMLTGAPPFSGATPLAVALKHSAETPRPLREIIPTIPGELDQVVLHALEKNPEKRPQNAGEFRRELFGVGEQLGLVRPSGFSVPTAAMLREAGTETPSGRLVIDIERLRESRSTLGGAKAAEPVTAENPAASHTIGIGRHTPGETAAGKTTLVATPHDATANPSASTQASGMGSVPQAIDAARDWFKNTWTRQPAVIIGGGVGVLVLCAALIAGVSRLASPPSSGVDKSESSAGEQAVISAADSSEPQAQNGQSNAPVTAAVVMRDPQTANDFYERSGALFAARDYAGAEKDLRRALELQPSFPEAHNRLGRTLVEAGKFTAAIAEYRRAIEERNGDFAIANFNLGDALERAGDYRDAIKAYEAAIANRGGGYPEAHFEIGRIHFNRNRNDQAAASFRGAIDARAGERNPAAYYYLGVSLARASNFTEAEPALRTAIEQRDGNYPEATYALGLLYENTKRYTDAVQAYDTYLQQQPDAVNRRQVESALRTMRRRIEANPAQ